MQAKSSTEPRLVKSFSQPIRGNSEKAKAIQAITGTISTSHAPPTVTAIGTVSIQDVLVILKSNKFRTLSRKMMAILLRAWHGEELKHGKIKVKDLCIRFDRERVPTPKRKLTDSNFVEWHKNAPNNMSEEIRRVRQTLAEIFP